jgi:cell division protein FtsZ
MMQSAFVPPPAEQPLRARAMPNIDEFPVPAQNLMRAAGHQAAAAPAAETRRRTLLERLATFGMSRAEEQAAHSAPQMAAPQIAPQMAPPAIPAPAPAQVAYAPRPAQPSPAHAEYAKRPPAQRPASAVDANGRGYPRAEEDHLEIPAFLRRQSN